MTRTTNAKGVYAIYDKIAGMLIGNVYALVIMPHPAAAVRLFQDGLQNPETALNKHPADYELVQLGFLSDKNELINEFRVILTGEAWLAAQNQQPSLVKEA